MKTQVIINDEYKKVYQSRVLNNGEFDYRLFIELIKLEHYTGEKIYGIDVYCAKTKDFISKENLNSACSSYCLQPEDLSDYDISDYGLRAKIDGYAGSFTNIKAAQKAIKPFKNNLPVYEGLLGFYLDKQQNRIGNNGWDFLVGDIGFLHEKTN